VQPQVITDIALMTVEGENDDISGVGQTQAAHTVCSGLSTELRELYVQPVVGHYGVFNGRRFRQEIYPRVRDFIRKHDRLGADAPAATTPEPADAPGSELANEAEKVDAFA
jgi:poly(3-hydroxybutyrate) depolymerase